MGFQRVFFGADGYLSSSDSFESECCENEPEWITEIIDSKNNAGVFVGNDDFYYQKFIYDGWDISTIEYYNGCVPGKIKNTYLYDADHRLDQATNYIYTPTRVKDNYSSHYRYDDAGNITHLSRNGFLGLDANQEPLYGLIDDLTYIYDLDFYLTDVVNNITTASEDYGFKGAASSYTYDLNGNMTAALLSSIKTTQ